MSSSAKPIKPQNKGTKTLSNNPIIERLSRTNSAVPISIFLALSAFLMVWGYLNTQVPWLRPDWNISFWSAIVYPY